VADISTDDSDDRRGKAAWACDALDAAYGTLTWRSHGEPLASLVMTILSQHTSDANSERAFDNLRRAFPGGWDAVRTAGVPAIADAIRSGGLADAKAPRIQGVLQAIYEKRGASSLDFLDELSTEEARRYLLEFHGVGPKTAACVLMFSLGRPVLPVDTHVFRVSHRLGLIEKRLGEARAHDALQALLPPERVYAFHVHMIRHGRRVCVATRPRCGECVLSERCDYFKAASGGNGAFATPRASEGGRRAKPTIELRSLHGLPPPADDADDGDAKADPAVSTDGGGKKSR
jgi:endonuclease-3